MNGIKQEKSLPAWLCIILFLIGISTMNGILKLFTGLFFKPYIFAAWKHFRFIPDLLNETWMLISVLFIAAILLHFGENKTMHSLGMSTRNRFGDFCMGFVVALLIMGIGFYMLIKIGEIRIVHIRFYKQEFLISLLLFAIVALVEEIAIRGYILGRLLRSHMNRFIALFLSAVIFSLMHTLNNYASFISLLNIFLAGLLLGATYIYTHNLWYPLSLHFFWNVIEGPVLGFQVSGSNDFASIIKLKRGTDIFMNGGNFGFEGSFICTIILLVFIVLTIWIMENRRHNAAIIN